MNCPQCKNPIQDNATECEWCGSNLNKSNLTTNKILFFTAKWCGPCKMFMPIILKYKSVIPSLTIEIIDVDTQKKIVSDFGVENIPTLISIKNGMVVDKLIGAQPSKSVDIFFKSNSFI